MNLELAIKIVEKIRKNSELPIQEYEIMGFKDYTQPDEDLQIKCIEKVLEMEIKIDIVNAPVFGINDNGKFISIPIKSFRVIDEFDFDFDFFPETKSMFFYQWLKLPKNGDLIRLATYEKKVDIWKTM